MHTLKIMDIPEVNEKGWNIYIQTDYLEDNKTNELSINMEELFDTTLKEVFKYTLNQFLSPKLFIDIKLYDPNQVLIPYDIDWETLVIKTKDDSREYQRIVIAIYIDTKYLNETVATINNISNERINKTNTQ